MQALLRLAGWIDRFHRTVAAGTAWLLVLMIAVGAYNAVARYVERGVGLRLSSNALLELQWYLFSLAFLLGAPYALRCGDHVRVDVISGGLPPRGRWWLDLLGTMLLLVPFCAAAIWLSIPFVAESFAMREGSSDPGGLPRWPLKPVVPLAFALVLLQGLAEAVRRWAWLRGSAPPDEAGAT